MTLIALAVAFAADGIPKITKHVMIDGTRYRVTIRGQSVEVAKKAFAVMYSVEERDAQRRAVAEATGCRVVDELPGNDARLRGKLDCAPR